MNDNSNMQLEAASAEYLQEETFGFIPFQDSPSVIPPLYLNEHQDHESTISSFWSDKEFENLSDQLHRSYCSSQMDFEDDQFREAHRMMPYDYLTQRKTKRYFKEDPINLTHGLVSKDYVA